MIWSSKSCFQIRILQSGPQEADAHREGMTSMTELLIPPRSERMAVSSIVTDRALREIYLLPFMIAIREAHPGAIMTSYNKVNGLHAAEHPELLQNILRNEWGWEGLIMSDW